MKKRNIFLTTALIVSCFISAQNTKENKDSKSFSINKNLEIFNSVLREADILYVDTINIEKTVKNGIDYMLNSLDPYTVYFNEEDITDLNFITTGEYAGVGSTITFKDDKIMFAEPFEGKPAAKAGIKAGDIILEIDKKDMTKCEKKEGEPYARTLNAFVSNTLKGEPGTTIEVKVQRVGHKKPLTFKIVREKIIIDPIAYTDILADSIGYIKLTSFTTNSAADVKNSLAKMKEQGIKGMILDLRNNGGGILEEAVQIVNLFVPKGKTVVTTKGRLQENERNYKTTIEPIDTEIPLVVLINEQSASASEIVAGALQDLDRAVIIGKKSFGKGLVQMTREIPYGGAIKVTTSKYYIPSGRCVQALDYSHKKEDGTAKVTPDSLKNVFYTEVGRKVLDGGGITPDINEKEEKTPNIVYYLNNQYIIFDWVSDWTTKHKNIEDPKTFTISNEDYDNFKEFVKTKKFEYDKISEKTMAQLKEVMEFEGYYKVAEDEFKALEAKLVPDLDRDLDLFQEQITRAINTEIAKRYFYQKGELAAEMKHDADVNKAIEIINNPKEYKEILTPKKEDEKKEKGDKKEKRNLEKENKAKEKTNK